MQLQEPATLTSGDERQRMAITQALTNAMADEYVHRTLAWPWDQLAVSCVPNSAFHDVHYSSAFILSKRVRQADFLAVRAEQSIPEQASFQVNQEGRLYHVREDISSSALPGDASEYVSNHFFARVDITSHVNQLNGFAQDLELLAKMARMTGGFISSNDRIAVGQWLRFHNLPLPTDDESTKALIDLLNFAVMPDTENYWELLDAPADSPFALTKNNRAIIRDITAQLTGNEMPLADYFGASLVLENAGSDKQPQSLEYRLQRLISDAGLLDETGQNYMDALGWFADESGAKPSKQLINQLLVAAMLLDLDPDIDTANTTFAGFKLHTSAHVQRLPSDIRSDLEAHLIQRCKLHKLIAPLVAELVLAGMAPAYLVRDLPPSLKVGTPGWVILSQAVGLAESVVPGAARRMTYAHVLGFSPISELTPQLNELHAMAGVDPVVTWALMNGLIQRDADGNLSLETINQGIEAYNEHVEALSTALNAINRPIPRRKALALKALTSGIPACNPHERLVKHRGSGGGGGREVSVLDLYMSDQLHTQDWGRIRGRDIYQEFAGLKELFPVADLYETAVHNHYNDLIAGLSTTIRYVLSQLTQSNRKFIEHGRLAIYRVEAYKPHFDAGSIPEATRERTGRYGVIIGAELQGTLVRCFELFPLRSECRSTPELREKVGKYLFAYDEDGTRSNFVEDNSLLDAPLDLDAYFKNAAPRSDATSSVFVRKIGEFDSSWHPTHADRPMAYFNAERIKTISNLIAEQHPFLTESELADMGRDSTEQELAAAKFDVIFNTLLNLIIPLKECIEGLSSGVPARQRDAIASCVMDAAVVAFVFASVPVQVGKAVGKSASLATKLLSASRIGTRTVASLLNPLDGVPTLINGGLKLVGKGAIKLGGHAVGAAQIARSQLHHLTGAHSYNLLRALDHTGEAARIRMSLDTVSHARALFKSDGITTLEEVVARLSDKTIPLPKGADPAELQHLFNSAARDATLQSKQAQQLGALIGQKALEDVLTAFMTTHPTSYTNKLLTAQDYFDTLADVAEIEAKKAIYLRNHQQSLLQLDLGQPPYNAVLAEAAFNPKGFTDPLHRAGAWMANGASSQANDFDSFVSVLREYAGNSKSLTDPDVITHIHDLLAPAVAGKVRDAGQPTKYTGSIAGYALMEQHLKTLDTAHQHFDKHLLSTVIGFQGFGDGNGRTASALYAISQLRSGRFTPLPREVVDLLSGIR
ncbi:hypothetical protein BK666_04915 [Pseudomonas frederiksbergensis]|uniref:Fido domain-containing protein n=1 Tax=Pseudomonas frederiksbergensis TaxID=104087 RepID=A0A423KDK8_9PSED|nr:hypothetical protein [Pseudomonas frederiksbergensis]RON50471.1 hypothetical protein BK666_04915 [Pseudomonas frederiksbergensis]